MVTSGTCELCSKTASSKCAGCGIAYYCSREHQKAHWSKHKHICKPFTVKEDGVLGRHLVATRRIRRGEVVLKERPLLVGPAQGTPPVCLGCLNGMTRGPGQPLACERCGWPMCSRQCAESPQHRPECQWTVAKRKSKVKISQLNVSPHPTYACVLPLRYCYQKSNNPKLFEKLEGLESHRKERKDTDKYNWDKFGVVQLLRRFYSLPDSEFTDEQLLDICGVIQVNGHEVPLSEPGHVGIYWKCSMLEHSCWANCSKSFTEAGEVLVRAAADIAEGEHLSICYTDPLWSTPQRRYHLKETKFFECNCPRCSDPTEMGTYFSVFRCTQRSVLVG
ncbi:hypothetical protein AAG570_005905 [Ranatra chinensis]|uniref:MYND-type domain-containing protein n=1 Tax=Ranatra chinensis TaxID=642074 RepID=A0ABD0XZ43_9HEMI